MIDRVWNTFVLFGFCYYSLSRLPEEHLRSDKAAAIWWPKSMSVSISFKNVPHILLTTTTSLWFNDDKRRAYSWLWTNIMILIKEPPHRFQLPSLHNILHLVPPVWVPVKGRTVRMWLQMSNFTLQNLFLLLTVAFIFPKGIQNLTIYLFPFSLIWIKIVAWYNS